jgi:hypothetical protein
MICLTYPSLGDSADFANDHTVAILSAWLKRERPREQVVFSKDMEVIAKCDEVWCTSASEAFGKANEMGLAVTGMGHRFVVGGHHVSALPESLLYGEAFVGDLDETETLAPDWDVCGCDGAKQYVAMSSFGCPYKCSFCSSSRFWGRHVYKRVEAFASEIEALKARGVKYVNVFDDLFSLDVRRLARIAERVGSLQMEFGCLMRADSVSEERLTLLRNMGVKNIAFGAESGSDRVLALMNKMTTAEQNQRAADMLVGGGFGAVCSMIAGYPGETEADLDLTLEFARRNRERKMLVKVYPCIPFPGTELWDAFAATREVDVRSFDWSSLRMDGVDWDRYPVMVGYGVERLREAVETA